MVSSALQQVLCVHADSAAMCGYACSAYGGTERRPFLGQYLVMLASCLCLYVLTGIWAEGWLVI